MPTEHLSRSWTDQQLNGREWIGCLLFLLNAMSLNALHLENYRETHEADTTNWQDNEAEDTLTRRILAKATTSIRRHRWHEAEDHLRDDIEYIKNHLAGGN